MEENAMKELSAIADLTLKLRTGSLADAPTCSEICYQAFKKNSEHHNFPSDFSSADVTQELISRLFFRSDIYSVVAEVAGQIVGSNFLSEETTIAGVGPLSVAPTFQNATLGRHLMTVVLDRTQQQGFVGVRLVQAAFHNRSLALYTKLGYVVREPLATIQGQALGIETSGYPVRPATFDDLEAFNHLCQQIHYFDRDRELSQAIRQGTATVVEHGKILTGYASSIGFFGHAVGVTNEDLKGLIRAAKSFEGQGFLLPMRNSQLFRWCIQQGLRIVQPMTLMSLGLYHHPAGAFLPSILF
jgi:predicted N-acetyltransferase YhbS